MPWPETVTKKDLVLTWFSGTGAGGQHRNKHQNCCRMLHKPTGIVSQCQDHRSREQNRRQAFKRLAAKLVPLMLTEEQRQRFAAGKERIRTYHAIRHTVKDERTGLTYSYESILDGDGLQGLISDVHAHFATETLCLDGKDT